MENTLATDCSFVGIIGVGERGITLDYALVLFLVLICLGISPNRDQGTVSGSGDQIGDQIEVDQYARQVALPPTYSLWL